MKKPRRWLSNCPEILAMQNVLEIMNTKNAWGPTRDLAKSTPMSWRVQWFRGLQLALQGRFDERMILGGEPSYEVPVLFTGEEHYNPVETYEIFYAGVDKDAEHWRPLLKEARERLEGKVSTSAEVKKGTAFYEQISRLAPGWVLAYVQIYRAPKVSKVTYQEDSRRRGTYYPQSSSTA